MIDVVTSQRLNEKEWNVIVGNMVARGAKLSDAEVKAISEYLASRVYIIGNSLGGAGTWYLGQKYPERFVAIAPSALPIVDTAYPYERLRGTAVFAIDGQADAVT